MGGCSNQWVGRLPVGVLVSGRDVLKSGRSDWSGVGVTVEQGMGQTAATPIMAEHGIFLPYKTIGIILFEPSSNCEVDQ